MVCDDGKVDVELEMRPTNTSKRRSSARGHCLISARRSALEHMSDEEPDSKPCPKVERCIRARGIMMFVNMSSHRQA
jgi:hypothetical protein